MNAQDVYILCNRIEAELEGLLSELERLPRQLEAAIKGSDASSIRELKARERELNESLLDYVVKAQGEVRAAQQANSRITGAAVSEAEDKLEAVKRNLVTVTAEYERVAKELEAELKLAQETVNTALSNAGDLTGRLVNLDSRLQSELRAVASAV